MFDADRPIIHSSQDHLNRDTFAKYLARCMLDQQSHDSFVIGLYGKWGSGKTSLINLIMEELNYAANNLLDSEKPIILNFNAWNYAGQHQLLYSFFRRLSYACQNAAYFSHVKHLAYLLELYASFFTHRPVPLALCPSRNFIKKISFQHAYPQLGWESGQDLINIKNEINNLLKKQKHKIIIFIDNISNISFEEIQQVFQIIKSLADFSNTAYLLSFDKEEILKILKRAGESEGEALLDKIIQLPFSVPVIAQQDLENLLAERILPILDNVPADAWNAQYWADVYCNTLKYLFTSTRDITRYLNILNFSYMRVRDTVNPVDYFALTALETFLPSVYQSIRENKDLFTDLLDQVFPLNEEQRQREKLRCDNIIQMSDKLSPSQLLSLLIILFPRLQRIYYPNLPYYDAANTIHKLKRIASPDFFDIYFRLSMQIGDIASSEFEMLLDATNSKTTFDQTVTRLNQDGRILKFIDRLDSSEVINKLSNESVPVIISVLLNNGDLFPPGLSSALHLDTNMRIHRIIHSLLRKENKQEERFTLLQQAINEATKSLYILIHELNEQSRQHLPTSDMYIPLAYRDLMPAQLDALRQLTVAKIKIWAENGSLSTHPKLKYILNAWREWSHDNSCQQYILDLIETEKGLLAFLTAMLEKPLTDTMIKHEKNANWEIDLREIEIFVPLNQVVKHAKHLFENDQFNKLTEREQLAITIFLDLTKTVT